MTDRAIIKANLAAAERLVTKRQRLIESLLVAGQLALTIICVGVVLL